MIDDQQQRDKTSRKKPLHPRYSISDYDTQRTTPTSPPPDERSSVRERIRKRRINQNANSISDWAWVIFAAVLFALVLIVSIAAFVLVQNSRRAAPTIPIDGALDLLPTPVIAYREYEEDTLRSDTLVLYDSSAVELAPWDGQSRFTLVLAGLDRRPGETGLTYRTDSMMLVSIDPITESIGILSIPRDLFVEVPGYSQPQRINTALALGETQSAGYGAALMMQTVQLNLGVRVHDYVIVDFQAFVDLVDAVGGIDVETSYTINDTDYPDMVQGFDPFYLPAGNNHLNGADALRFARTRHGDSDIQRAQRQQQVIFALREQILDLNMLPVLVGRAPDLWNSWQDNVYTGLTLEQIVQLGLFVKDIPSENIQTGVINYDYLESFETQSGAQVLIPNRQALGMLMIDVFGANYSQ